VKLGGALLLIALATPALAAEEADWGACRHAIAAAEPAAGLPPGLLLAIALVESGLPRPGTGALHPWPWSWNVEGAPGFAADRAGAIAAVAALQAAGRRSIDIGCMQVNLAWHPGAFTDLAAGFDPARNIAYAAAFLRELRARHGDWPTAIAHYHSAEEARGAAYQRRVTLQRLGAAWAGGGGVVPLGRDIGRGLCPAGRAPALILRRAGGVRGNAPTRTAVVCRGPVRPGSAPAPG